ncbi:hypothetical protein ACOME3_000606 [Neoechinorhynchus agilis]
MNYSTLENKSLSHNSTLTNFANEHDKESTNESSVSELKNLFEEQFEDRKKIPMHCNKEEEVKVVVDNEGRIVGYSRNMPHVFYENIWNNLFFDKSLTSRVLRAAQANIVIPVNLRKIMEIDFKITFLYGPPGTGKSSIARAVCQKISIIHRKSFKKSILYEIDIGSLVSKWASQSSRIIVALFNEHIRPQLVNGVLVLVIMDEIDGIIECRNILMKSSGIESLRIVNTFIRQIDMLKSFTNLSIIVTSNVTTKIDSAILDRIPVRIKIGPPCLKSIRLIFLSILKYLSSNTVLNCTTASLLATHDTGNDFERICDACVGLSCRRIRSFPSKTLETFPESRFDINTFMKRMLEVINEFRANGEF